MDMKAPAVALLVATSLLSTGPGFSNEPVWDGNKVELVSMKLDDGVFAYYPSDAKELESQGQPVATSGGFIIGEKGVLLVDTMLNERLNTQVQNLVKAQTNKPIIYAPRRSTGANSYT